MRTIIWEWKSGIKKGRKEGGNVQERKGTKRKIERGMEGEGKDSETGNDIKLNKNAR